LQDIRECLLSTVMKKVTKVYRGQTYELEIPDYSVAPQETQNQSKSRRKYRGQYID
jgi:hypothetical protein